MPFIPNTDNERNAMLHAAGAADLAAQFADIPSKVKLNTKLKLPPALSEIGLKKELRGLAEKNKDATHYPTFLGGGAYNHFIPSVVGHIISRSEFYTAYTPYQPEISQGVLQTIFEYQSMICGLTGMDIANASLYDGGTALAEALNLAVNVSKQKRIILPKSVNPHYREIVKTYGAAAGWKIEEITLCAETGTALPEYYTAHTKEPFAAIIIQQPNFFGSLEEVEQIAQVCHERGALLIVAVDPISLGILKRPGDYGADIVVGEGQSLGIPLFFGGPYLGIFAVKAHLARHLPGRIVGETVDTKGRRGYVLTLQTREQHIRRERATSNICSNEALCALAATVYLTAMGKHGLRAIAELCLQKSNYLKNKISQIKGYNIAFTSPTFKEFVVKTPVSPEILNKKLLAEGIIGGLDLSRYGLPNHWLLCATEMINKAEMDNLINILQ